MACPVPAGVHYYGMACRGMRQDPARYYGPAVGCPDRCHHCAPMAGRMLSSCRNRGRDHSQGQYHRKFSHALLLPPEHPVRIA